MDDCQLYPSNMKPFKLGSGVLMLTSKNLRCVDDLGDINFGLIVVVYFTSKMMSSLSNTVLAHAFCG